ncbi:MAG: hypothetical protein IH891_08500, partial [Planctomycetes bacterium]|nr:hypothetical protein [Planctomycetota bacterium]
NENLLWPTDRSAIVDIDIDGRIFAETGQVREGYQSLSPLMYSLDTLVPIVDFHQQKYWLPNAEQGWGGSLLRVYLWVHIAAGWFFSTMLVIGLTGLARSK